jgi:hypothetical protein
MTASDITRSNSLADLAARIKTEHEATSSNLKRGLSHAIAAGQLLIKAKEQLKHGKWLPWLSECCQVPERTAQAYMRVAKSFGNLGDRANTQRVADLSFRDSLRSLAMAGSVAKGLQPEKIDRVLQRREADPSESWQRAIALVRRADHATEAHQSMQRSAKQSVLRGKYRVARNPAGREWFIAVLPDMTEAELREKQKSALKTATASSLQQTYDELSAQAASLEADAEKLETKARKIRKQAAAVKQNINNEVGKIIGPVSIATQVYRVACNEATDAEIAALDTKRRAQYLLDSKDIAPRFTTWGIPDWLRGSEPDDVLDPPNWIKTLSKAEAVASLSASAAATAAEQRPPDDGLDIPESLRRVAP